ncbi:hypothetical protein HispidOSU_016118, partial [Sigmodon hispidus]
MISLTEDHLQIFSCNKLHEDISHCRCVNGMKNLNYVSVFQTLMDINFRSDVIK